MFTPKYIRKVVTLTIAAMSAVILTGCTNTAAEPESSQELTDVVSSNTSAEVTTITEPTEPATEPITEPATEPAESTAPATEPVIEPSTTPDSSTNPDPIDPSTPQPNQDLKPDDQPTGSEVAEQSEDKITVANAAEYYPYLGWCGYIPSYVEIYPGDSEATIQEKIDWNAKGYSVSYYWGPDEEDHPQHFFTSEADYLAWKKKREEGQRSYQERIEQSNEDIRNGIYSADFGTTDEESWAILEEVLRQRGLLGLLE